MCAALGWRGGEVQGLEVPYTQVWRPNLYCYVKVNLKYYNGFPLCFDNYLNYFWVLNFHLQADDMVPSTAGRLKSCSLIMLSCG